MNQKRHFGMVSEGYDPKLWCFLGETTKFKAKRWWWRKKKNVERIALVVLTLIFALVILF